MTIPRHVLLVEDNPGDADLMRDTLETSGAASRIATAVDGADALDYLRRTGGRSDGGIADIVILDLNLPRMDGWEMLAALRADSALRSIPVVVLTSSDSPRDIRRAYELGANAYAVKPVSLAAFQTVVRGVEAFWLSLAKLP